jgi:predicted glutamine amidotransferase
MCVIAIKPAGFSFCKKDIDNMHETNPNGFGIMWSQNGELKTARIVPTGKTQAWSWYTSLKIHAFPAVLHFRLATHGSVCEQNTHPFEVIPNLAMVHNGVISGLPADSRDITDTQIYVERYIRPLLLGAVDPLVLVQSPAIKEIIGKHVGYSKLVFMDNTGNTTIINESMGDYITRKGQAIWVSNTHWKEDHTPKYRKSYADMLWESVMYYEKIDLYEMVLEDHLNKFYRKNPHRAMDLLEDYESGHVSLNSVLQYV